MSTVEWYKFKLCLRVSYTLSLLLYCCRNVKGLVEISPSGVASVCQEGDQLELMCTIPGMFQRWDFTVILGNGAVMNFMHSVTADGPSGVLPPVTVNSTMFTYSRLSARDRLPLISRLIISSVSEGLNGVEVSCMDLEASESTTTTIRIIGVGDTQTSKLSIQTHSEQFLSDRVTVILKWTLSNPPSYYQQLLRNVSIDVLPDLEVPITYIRNMSVQLTLQYNTQYNVSVTQPGICGQPNQTAYMYIKLNYIKCSNPIVLTRTNVRVVGYEDPALEGENITFTCTSGPIGTGPISATCMGNGEWEPDPREVNCTGTGMSTDDGTTTSLPAECMPNESENMSSTCSTPRLAGSDISTLWIVIGAIIGVAFAVIIIVIVLAIVMKRKGFRKHHIRELEHRSFGVSHGDPNSCKIEGTLLYADIGPTLFPRQQKSTLLDLDDSHVEYALLNHSLHEDKVSTLQESSIVMENTITDNCPSVNLDSLLIQLRPQITPKWYQFGEAAGIEKEALDKFAEQCSPEECIVETLDYWLRNSVEHPTWKTVAKVLKTINLTKLGLDIERVYITGTLPVEVDMNRIPKLDSAEAQDEIPPPLPERSANMFSDSPSHTFNSGSQGQEPTATTSLLPPSVSNETSAPALPPKPANMKTASPSVARSNPHPDRD